MTEIKLVAVTAILGCLIACVLPAIHASVRREMAMQERFAEIENERVRRLGE
jgi:hypothetical protein